MIIRFTPCILKLMVESLGYVTLFTVQSRFFIKLGLVQCSNVSTNSFNLQRDTFVYHHWGYTPIYLSLSYPLRSLLIVDFFLEYPFMLSEKLASQVSVMEGGRLTLEVKVVDEEVISFPVWLRNRIITAGLEPVLGHTNNSWVVSYYRQISTNNKIKIKKLIPDF